MVQTEDQYAYIYQTLGDATKPGVLAQCFASQEQFESTYRIGKVEIDYDLGDYYNGKVRNDYDLGDGDAHEGAVTSPLRRERPKSLFLQHSEPDMVDPDSSSDFDGVSTVPLDATSEELAKALITTITGTTVYDNETGIDDLTAGQATLGRQGKLIRDSSVRYMAGKEKVDVAPTNNFIVVADEFADEMETVMVSTEIPTAAFPVYDARDEVVVTSSSELVVASEILDCIVVPVQDVMVISPFSSSQAVGDFEAVPTQTIGEDELRKDTVVQ